MQRWVRVLDLGATLEKDLRAFLLTVSWQWVDEISSVVVGYLDSDSLQLHHFSVQLDLTKLELAVRENTIGVSDIQLIMNEAHERQEEYVCRVSVYLRVVHRPGGITVL